jgi:hypothetical protein
MFTDEVKVLKNTYHIGKRKICRRKLNKQKNAVHII